jgi:hypothetical protein
VFDRVPEQVLEQLSQPKAISLNRLAAVDSQSCETGLDVLPAGLGCVTKHHGLALDSTVILLYQRQQVAYQGVHPSVSPCGAGEILAVTL